MPLRGKHPGHRPFRIRIEEPPSSAFPKGRTLVKSFHWRGPWEEEIDYCTRRKWVHNAWVAE